MNWIILTLSAVVLQTVRNALQSRLSMSVSTSGVTLSRFVLAPPVALCYLIVLSLKSPGVEPDFSTRFVFVVLLAALFQISATSLMVILFKQKNFATGAGLAKSEALVAAVVGVVFFGSHLTAIGWTGIVIGGVAVFLISSGSRLKDVSFNTMLIGLGCGACFALSSLLVRQACFLIGLNSELAAAWVLFLVLCVQTVALCGYVLIKKPYVFNQLLGVKQQVLVISLISCLGSVCWFTAMALQNVALVKTLGQVELLLTILLSRYWLKNKTTRNDILGLSLIALAAIMVVWA